MAITALQLVARVTADTSEAEKGLQQVRDEADKASGQDGSGGGIKGLIGNMLSIAGGIGIVSAAGSAFGFLGGLVSDSIQAAQEAQQAQAQLAQGIQSTNDASGESVDTLEALADKYSTLTTFSKTAIEQSEGITLTFTNIGKNIFPQATSAAEDMSTRLGVSLPDATMMLDKALQDPIKGVTALRRVGVDLSAQQVEQVKHFMKVGDAADAQKVILGELNKEMGGSAQAAGKTFGGQLQILQNQLENTKEKVGGALLPVLTNLLNLVMPLATQFANNLPGAIKGATTWFNANLLPTIKVIAGFIVSDLVPAVVNIAGKIGDFIGYLQTHQPAMDAFKAILLGVAIAVVGALVPAFIAWAAGAAAAAVATIIATAPIILIGAAIGALILGIYELVSHWKQVTTFLSTVWKLVMEGVKIDLALVGAAFGALGKVASGIWGGIQSAFKAGVNLVIGDLNGFIKFLDSIQIHVPAIGVGPVHTPAFDWNGLGIPPIPYLASGGDILDGGAAIVGERGPELLTNARGARVSPLPGGLGAAAAGAGGGMVQVTTQINLDGRRIAEVVTKHQPSIIRNSTGARAF